MTVLHRCSVSILRLDLYGLLYIHRYVDGKILDIVSLHGGKAKLCSYQTVKAQPMSGSHCIQPGTALPTAVAPQPSCLWFIMYIYTNQTMNPMYISYHYMYVWYTFPGQARHSIQPTR